MDVAGAGHGHVEAFVAVANEVAQGGRVTEGLHQVFLRLEVAVAVHVNSYIAAVLAGEIHVIELQPHALCARNKATVGHCLVSDENSAC